MRFDCISEMASFLTMAALIFVAPRSTPITFTLLIHIEFSTFFFIKKFNGFIGDNWFRPKADTQNIPDCKI